MVHQEQMQITPKDLADLHHKLVDISSDLCGAVAKLERLSQLIFDMHMAAIAEPTGSPDVWRG